MIQSFGSALQTVPIQAVVGHVIPALLVVPINLVEMVSNAKLELVRYFVES